MPAIRALAVVALLLAAPSGAFAQTVTSSPVDEAAEELRTDSVYVSPDNAAGIDEADADRIREAIRRSDVPVIVAVFPPGAGEPLQLAAALNQQLRQPAVYGVIAGPGGRSFEAGQTVETGLDEGVARTAATDAIQTQRDAGGTAILLSFVDRLGQARANGGSLDEGFSFGTGLLGALAAIAGAVGLFALLRRRRARREEAEQAAELRRVVDDDLIALGDDIRALDLDVEMPDADPRGKSDYARALQAHETASAALQRAKRPEDFEPIAATLEQGRYAMESARARLDGREPPEHRPPCFFDPRHGTSSRDVEWTPDFGAPRLVPACEADAQRVERGEDPHAREVEVAGSGRVPYWHAPAYYGPYAGGFFGGFGGGGLLTGLFAGSLLASAWTAPLAWGAGDAFGGDFGGGGGDFGGGGGFGGDFGGGGDF